MTPPPMPEPPQSQPPLPVMSYATQAPSNQPAVLSFVFGLLVFIPFVVPGVLAILFGRRGLKVAKEQAAGRAGLAKFGIVLGVINVVLSLLFAATLPFALVKARQQSQQVACAANLRALAQAAMIYAAQNRGAVVPSVDHLGAVFVGAGGGGGPVTTLFTCPACAGNPAKPPVVTGTTVASHYYLLMPAARMNQVKQPQNVVLLYEPLTHHNNLGMNVAFCDGHVEFIAAPLAAKIAAELAAGQNPPPSKP